jgi:hypothetical protein
LFRDEAEKDFLECSELAQAEIKAFHQRRITEFRLALLYYTEVFTCQGVTLRRVKRFTLRGKEGDQLESLYGA